MSTITIELQRSDSTLKAYINTKSYKFLKELVIDLENNYSMNYDVFWVDVNTNITTAIDTTNVKRHDIGALLISEIKKRLAPPIPGTGTLAGNDPKVYPEYVFKSPWMFLSATEIKSTLKKIRNGMPVYGDIRTSIFEMLNLYLGSNFNAKVNAMNSRLYSEMAIKYQTAKSESFYYFRGPDGNYRNNQRLIEPFETYKQPTELEDAEKKDLAQMLVADEFMDLYGNLFLTHVRVKNKK